MDLQKFGRLLGGFTGGVARSLKAVLAGSDGAVLYFVTDYGAERGRLVAMDTGQSSLPITEVVPQAAERLQAARLKDGKMSLSYAGASGPVIRTVDQASLARR